MIKYEIRVYSNGTKIWYLNGKELTEEQFNQMESK